MDLPKPGELFLDKYKVLQVLGRGGFAIVYRATDIQIGRDVAIKILSPRDGSYPDGIVSRFHREARVIAGLQDQHTITMFEYGRSDNGLLFMVFEYVRGVDLGEILRRRGALPPGIAVHILRQVLFALREAHGAGVLHRDIKPDNILVHEYMGDEYVVKLLDFGIAKPVMAPESGDGNITRAGAMVGTPRYMAPEQVFAAELSAATDIYSLGLVAYELLVGRPAIGGASTKERIREQISETPIRVPEGLASETLVAIVNRMTVRDAAGRYQSVDEVLSALDSPGVDQPPRKTRRPTDEVSATQSGAFDEAPAVSAEQPQPAISSVTRIAMIAGSTVAAGLALLLAFGGTPDRKPPAEPEPPVVVTPITPPPGTTKTIPPAEDEPEAEAAPAPRDGCGGDLRRDTLSMFADLGGRRRRWVVHVPAGYDSSRRYPVILAFHDAEQDVRGLIQETHLNKLAASSEFVLVAMEGLTEAEPWVGIDDIEVIPGVLKATGAKVCVDPSRLFAFGHGEGGNLAIRLACAIPLSAVATTGSSLAKADDLCAGAATPLLRIYGDKDNYVPSRGGKGCRGRRYMSAADQARLWRKRNECSGAATVWLEEAGGRCETWSCSAAPFVHCAVSGGHDWPGSVRSAYELPGCASSSAEFPFGETIWKFFEENGRSL